MCVLGEEEDLGGPGKVSREAGANEDLKRGVPGVSPSDKAVLGTMARPEHNPGPYPATPSIDYRKFYVTDVQHSVPVHVF